MSHPTEINELTPIPIHVASVSSDIRLAEVTAAKKCRRKSVYQTILLTANDPVQQILEPSDNRVIAWVQPIDQDVVLTANKGDGQSSRNTGDSTLANPTGALLKKVFDNGSLVPIDDIGEVWVAASVFPCRVTVIAVYER
jgi:hypothetical protein